MSRTVPFDNGVARRQPDQFERGLVAREVAARFDELAQLHMQRFDGMGRVDAFPNLRLGFRFSLRPGSIVDSSFRLQGMLAPLPIVYASHTRNRIGSEFCNPWS
jgi:hypothetical protein